MPITQPTIDDFSDTTVMRVIRKVVNYLVTLIPKVNEEIANVTDSAGERLDSVEANVEALNKELPTDIRVNYTPSTGNFNIDYVKEDGDVLTSNTVVIVSGTTGEVTIVQNTSGISINGIALQSATTAQPGLMTPSLVSSLNNVNDTTNDHTTMLNAQAQAITELDDRVDALEQAGGGEEWEEIDLTNFPRDWVIGDKVRALFKNLRTTPDEPFTWNETTKGVSISPSNGLPFAMVEVEIPQYITGLTMPLQYTWGAGYSGIIEVSSVGGVAQFNNINDSFGIFILASRIWNATGGYNANEAIYSVNVTTLIHKMWRLKR